MRDVPWEDIFKLYASAGASSYQVKPRSSSWFLAACADAIIHRNHFFIWTNRINLLNLKFRQVSDCCERVLDAAKLAYANKIKEYIITRILALQTFLEIANNEGKSAIPSLLNSPEVLSYASDKAILFAKNFTKNS